MPANPITAWSYSRLSVYRKCPRQFKYKFIDKLREPPSLALERGDALHKALQAYVEGRVKRLDENLFPSIGPLKKELDGLKKLKASCELELAVDERWRPTSWFDKSTWLRAKLDAQVGKPNASVVRIIDHKSGKEYLGAHAEQLEIYAAIVAPHQPLATEIVGEMWYVDLGKRVPAVFTDLKRTIPALQRKWAKLAAPIFRDTRWKPVPSRECNWCPFSGRKGGPCEKG